MSFSSEEFYSYDSFVYVDRIYEDYQADIDFYNKEVLAELPEAMSLFTNYKNHFSNIFLVSCANSFEAYFENEFPKILTSKNLNIHFNFLINQALKRKYFSLFNWEGKNANQFYGLFGEKFKELMKSHVDTDEVFKGQTQQFILLGAKRNKIVHSGMKLEGESIDVITTYNMFKDAQKFCESFFMKLTENLESL